MNDPRFIITRHNIQIGDPQRDETLAVCSCGEKCRSEDKSVLRAWSHRHIADMMVGDDA